MRQRDWARVFGIACVGAGFGLSIADYQGAQWDALICWMGALMLLRGGVERPSASRAGKVMWTLRLLLLMFAFAAVNRAQGGVSGAVDAALGNWVLWAVGAVLLALALFRKDLPMQAGEPLLTEGLSLICIAVLFWLLYGWSQGSTDMAALRTLIAVAVTANVANLWLLRTHPVITGIAGGIGMSVIFATPGEVLWPIGTGVLPVALLSAWLRRTPTAGA